MGWLLGHFGKKAQFVLANDLDKIELMMINKVMENWNPDLSHRLGDRFFDLDCELEIHVYRR